MWAFARRVKRRQLTLNEILHFTPLPWGVFLRHSRTLVQHFKPSAHLHFEGSYRCGMISVHMRIQELMVQEYRYTAVFELAEEGGYIVTFPAIPGLATQGETLDEARAMASDCLKAYLESLAKDGEPVPYEAPGEPITERVTVALSAA